MAAKLVCPAVNHRNVYVHSAEEHRIPAGNASLYRLVIGSIWGNARLRFGRKPCPISAQEAPGQVNNRILSSTAHIPQGKNLASTRLPM